jgi:DNA (cytosine-5)-methyltransferase 1
MKVIELFAGVGGFRTGFEQASNRFETVLANQWEPGSKVQHAANVYRKQFGDDVLVNEDLNVLLKNDYSFPNHDLLVGGFPCQDFSVANTLSRSKGLEGTKGNLWYAIAELIKRKEPKYCLFENVNRLLLSPALERGRDFAYMLATLNDMNYGVEWMVVDASAYGFPQKRKRVFFMCYKEGTPEYNNLKKNNSSVLKRAFPFEKKESSSTQLSFPLSNFLGSGTPVDVLKRFNPAPKKTKSAYKYNSPKKFFQYGTCIDREYDTYDIIPTYDGSYTLLGDIIVKDTVSEEFYVDNKALEAWKAEKGGYTRTRTTKDGFTYDISFGKMDLYDGLDEPSRTIITAEGGKSVSRMKHLIQTASGKSRRLIPLELERLNMFPDNFTAIGLNDSGEEYPVLDTRRAFLMGNAMVTGIVSKIGKTLLD